MFGMEDDTNNQLETLIEKWKKAAEAERRAALEAKRVGEPTMAAAAFGTLYAYQRCIADVKKLRGF